MISIGQRGAARVHISLKLNSLTLGIDDPAGMAVVSCDCAGRLWTAFFDGVAYRRGLDGQILAKRRAAGAARQRTRLNAAAGQALLERARALVSSVRDDVDRGALSLSPDLSPRTRQIMARAAAFDTAQSAADAARYRAIYQPVGILPPDQYLAVVLQATEGCAFNTCTFCNFYKSRRFRVKPLDEFRAHAAAVRDFLGDGLSLRRSIFLGDANALVLPMPRLVPLLEAVHDLYDVAALGGIYAFLDGFSGEKKSAGDYRVLADRGLRRVYIGLESGSAALLRFLNKPGKPDDALAAVRALKAAGVVVGVIVLLGAGGATYDADHVRATVALLNQMPLDQRDLIYFSELVVGAELPYARHAADAGIAALTPDAVRAQGERIRAGVRFTGANDAPKISRYDIEEFIY